MIIIKADDPDDALLLGINHLMNIGNIEASRAGEVLVSPLPVTTMWGPNRSLASLNPTRDANPFFHLNEAIWMLLGDNDATCLDTYVSDFNKRFGESNGTIHGAYGYRWRHAFGFDQLDWIIDKLKEDPHSRQCVLQMWDCRPELIGQNDLMGSYKDRPCNTHVYFRIQGKALDMTVCCRSNDMIWGAYGANIVHFGVLHEYVAAMTGVLVGTYYQMSNNFHAYMNVLGPLRIKMELATPWDRLGARSARMPIFDSPGTIRNDLRMWPDDKGLFNNNLFKFTSRANQVLATFRESKKIDNFFGQYDWDWAQACRGWLHRRR